jgi:hypothetical protein
MTRTRRSIEIINLDEVIRQRPTVTLWQAIKNFFNEANTLHWGDVITRTSLLDYLYNMGFGLQVRGIQERAPTIDTYRNYLKQAGYMRNVGRGRYMMVKRIPDDLTLTDVKKEAYGVHIGRATRLDNRNDGSSELRKAVRSLEIDGWSKKDLWDTRTKYPEEEQEDFLLESDFKV